MVIHAPARLPRPDFFGETLFAERWAQRMEGRPHPSAAAGADRPESLRSILAPALLTVDQRAATVAASFIAWLGTNMGQAFLVDVGRCRPILSFPGTAAWGVHNRRSQGCDFGFRRLEIVLCQGASLGDAARELSTRDYEIAEVMAKWVGDDGWPFVELCNREISAHHSAELARGIAASRANGPVALGATRP